MRICGHQLMLLLLPSGGALLLWQAALTTFDDTGSNEVDIELVTQEVTRLLRKCEAQLQRFGEQRSSSEADEKVHTANMALCSLHGIDSQGHCAAWVPRGCSTDAYCHS